MPFALCDERSEAHRFNENKSTGSTLTMNVNVRETYLNADAYPLVDFQSQDRKRDDVGICVVYIYVCARPVGDKSVHRAAFESHTCQHCEKPLSVEPNGISSNVVPVRSSQTQTHTHTHV